MIRLFKAWIETWCSSWCAIVHFTSHEKVHRGRTTDYYHCNECQRNWSEKYEAFDCPKIKHTQRGPSVFRSADDVH